MIPSTPLRLKPHFAMATVLVGLGIMLPAIHGQEHFEKITKAFFQSHCLRCHDSEKQKGEFRIDNLSTDSSNPIVAEKWAEIRFRMNAGEMPPPEEPQPTARALGEIVKVISKKLREGAAARMSRRGPVQHDRLSRQEYAHTVYDLLGVVFDVEAPGAFNEDPRWQGFDRIGAMLSVAPSHIERYFKAANTVIDLVFPDTAPPSKLERKSPGEGKRQLLQLGEGWSFDLKHPGRYHISIRASGLPAFTGRIPRLSLWHRHHNRSFAGMDLATAENDPQTIELEGLFPAGTYEIRNHARTQRHANGSYKLFRNQEVDANQPLASLKSPHPAPWTKVVDEEGRPVMPLLLVDWIEIEGPLINEIDQAKRKHIFPTTRGDSQQIKAGLHRFAERAWRRPVEAWELDRYVKLIATEQDAGESFQASFRSALASILVARRFFHLEVGSPNEQRIELNDFELASRLSYFLWSSMPDERLFEAARKGELRSPRRLAEEADRMIADPKIERFLDTFPRQWLQLHRVGMFQPDPKLYPEYDPWLEESMVLETLAYFEQMFREDLPLREIVDSDWSMINSRLAIHYDLPPPHPPHLTRYELGPDSGRGGLLTHAAILSLTSDGTRHRPVHRGAWVSEAILALTPPPPPPNVDPLEPVAEDKPKRSIRSKLEAHATDPTCVSCHQRIDPLGLAFENFDAIGRWRETEIVHGGRGDHPPVDASGRLPDGQPFNGPSEFKKLLARDARLADAFLEQLATYALRRVMTVDDIEQLQAISRSPQAGGHRLRSMVRQLVLSDLFKQR